MQRGQTGRPDTPLAPRPSHPRIGRAAAEPASEARGDRAGAIAYWSSAAAAAAEPRAQAAALLELAQAYETSGDLEHAKTALARADAVATDARAHAAVATVRARIRSRSGDPLALRSFEEALKSAPDGDEPSLLLDYANHLERLGSADDATKARARAAEVASSRDDGTSVALATLAQAASPAELERASGELAALPQSHEVLFARLHAADLVAEQARSVPALALHAAGLLAATAQAAEVLDDPLAASWAWGWMGGLYEDAGQLDEALELTRRAIAAADRADAPEALYLWQWQLGRLALARHDLSTALRALRASDATLSVLRARFALRDAGPLGSPREYPIEPVVTSLVDVLLRVAAQTPDGPAREALLFEARARLEDLNADELQDYFADECVAAQRHAAPEAVPGSLAIYPAVLPDRLELIVSAGGETSVIATPVSAAELGDEIRHFRRAAQDRTSEDFVAPATRLYDWIIRPLEPELARRKPDTLVFVSTGSLRGVPLGALRDAQNGEYLIERYAIAVAPGLTLTAPRALPGTVPALKAGLSEAVQGYPALVSVLDELAAVDRLYPGPTLLNQQFVEKQLESALASAPFGIVHLASHAEFGGSVDEAFILTYDGRLGMDRLAELVGITEFREQPLELLTLSACQTAAGNDRAALGLAGIAVKAGARSTVASLWYIEDQAAGRLMADFYGALAQGGMTRAAALRGAQLHLLADPATRHPASWAPFLLIGSWL